MCANLRRREHIVFIICYAHSITSLCDNIFKKIYFTFVYACVSVGGHMHIKAVSYGGQKKVLGALELELQMVVNCLLWALEAGVYFSEKSSMRS